MAYTTANQSVGDPMPASELEKLAILSEYAERSVYQIVSFIDRCRGTDSADAPSPPTPVRSGHCGQIERLSDALERLDNVVQELRGIG